MKKVLAVFPVDWSREETFGLLEKSVGLVDAARRQGLQVTACFTNGTTIYPYTGEQFQLLAKERGLRSAWFRYVGFWRKLGKMLEQPWDFVWVRGAHEPSWAQLQFLAKAEKTGAKVLLDLPTYPTEAEGGNLWRRGLRAIAPGYAEVAPHLSHVVTLSPHLNIYGRPTIRVKNGVTLAGPVARHIITGNLKLAGLGQWADWHGLDRLFHAIARSDNPRQFEIKLAGTGPASEPYQTLASALNLNVTWLPPAYGEARVALLDWADVGIGCLAIHRKGVYPDQALKHRQYAAAGLPFIATVSDPAWDHVLSVMQLASDDSVPNPVNLERFVFASRENTEIWAAELVQVVESMSWDQSYEALWQHILGNPWT